MRVLIQRVRSARVNVEETCVGQIERGYLLLVGIGKDHEASQAVWLAKKIAGLRLFEDGEGKMNLGLKDVGGACLAVSQFTLYADCRKGTRPGFSGAADAESAREGFDHFVRCLEQEGLQVETGQFQAHMQVELMNDGPVTVWLER